eukprot:6209368-Ditylum_brightwellii.AAC.1
MGTPFTTGPVQELFGNLAGKDSGVAFQQGQLDIDILDTDAYTKELLKELQQKDDDPPEIDCTITTKDIKSNYKNWEEATTPDEADDEWEGLTSNELFGIVEKIVKIASSHNYPLERWSVVHNLYILKKKNLYRVHKVRTIHKVESELNLFRREIISQRLMRNAERFGYLREDQHRERNGRAAQDIVLGKAYTFDTFHLQRSNFACTDCDAKA